MENENEYQEADESVEADVESTEAEETVDWQARATELEQKAIKQREKTKELKAKLAEYEAQKPKQESSEPDYAKLAFLKGEGITHPDDQKWVQDEARRLKLPLTDILSMAHAKNHLETSKDQRDAMAGMPKGRGRGGGTTQHDVDYWRDRKKADGTYETPEDHEMAVKVIDARIKKESNKNMFSDILYTG
jgi:hypothetical protein